jgi:hypothetical protein
MLGILLVDVLIKKKKGILLVDVFRVSHKLLLMGFLNKSAELSLHVLLRQILAWLVQSQLLIVVNVIRFELEDKVF